MRARLMCEAADNDNETSHLAAVVSGHLCRHRSPAHPVLQGLAQCPGLLGHALALVNVHLLVLVSGHPHPRLSLLHHIRAEAPHRWGSAVLRRRTAGGIDELGCESGEGE